MMWIQKVVRGRLVLCSGSMGASSWVPFSDEPTLEAEVGLQRLKAQAEQALPPCFLALAHHRLLSHALGHSWDGRTCIRRRLRRSC